MHSDLRPIAWRSCDGVLCQANRNRGPFRLVWWTAHPQTVIKFTGRRGIEAVEQSIFPEEPSGLSGCVLRARKLLPSPGSVVASHRQPSPNA